jgi:cysteine desulfuration protein SufE
MDKDTADTHCSTHSNSTKNYPDQLARIVRFFEGLDEEQKRENLILYAESARKIVPREGEEFDMQDVRKDEECADTVGVFLKVHPDRRVSFRMTLGPHVQTLTKAMASILCKGLEGAKPEEIVDLDSDFIPKIVGGYLVRQRSQTTYYVLSRMKGICNAWLRKQRASQ